MTFAIGLIALLTLLATWQDAFEVMLLPRRVQRQVRFMRIYFRSTWAAWSFIALRVSSPTRREHLLGLYGPLSMLPAFQYLGRNPGRLVRSIAVGSTAEWGRVPAV